MKHTKGNKYKSENLLIVDIETDKALYFDQILKMLNQHAEMYELMLDVKSALSDYHGDLAKLIKDKIDSIIKEIDNENPI